MKRVVVIGCPGAGKTTFARKLAAKTKLPLTHLDYYYHQKKYDYNNNREAWVARVKKLVKQDAWIIDGNYSSTFDQRFKRADTIIFLDFPRRTSMAGLAKRRIRYRNKLREDMPGDWEEKADLEFLRYVWRFRGEPRDRILTALDKAKDKRILAFKSRREAAKFLDGL